MLHPTSFDKDPQDCTVIVGMSGGVDSSVAASLLHRAGFNVVGVTLKLSQSEARISSCCSDKDIQDAYDVASKMGFTHYTLDYAKHFKEHVVDDFMNEYANGYTPNPCVRCNQKVKFGDLLSFARKINADAIATGHYIKQYVRDGNIELHRPKDVSKDQTYFMSMVARENIRFMRFPLGDYTKSEVRQIAADLNLPVANKKDSQDLCFVQNGTYRDMLAKIASKSGRGMVVNADDEVLGYHDGVQNYTVGQRKGIDIPNGPWFVLKLLPQENKIVVGRRNELFRSQFTIDSLNIMADFPETMLAQVRSTHNPVACKVENNIVYLDEPTHSIAPGQICAFYDGTRLLGGGRIAS